MIVGAGLAGLSAALRLAEDGARVVVLAKGTGSLHLGGHVIDVLGYAPDLVESPAASLPAFVTEHPDHPYAKTSVAKIRDALAWLEERAPDLELEGGVEDNLLLPSPVGVARPTVSAPASIAAGDVRRGGRLAIVGFRVLKDFYPLYLAANLGRAVDEDVRAVEIAVDLPGAWRGEADVNSLGLARSFEDEGFRETVARALDARLGGADRVGFPAVLGLDRAAEVRADLERRLGRPVFEIPTLPPSVPGIRLSRTLSTALARHGGRVVLGVTVVGGRDVSGNLTALVADAGGGREQVHEASSFVLATGGVAAGGVAMDPTWRISETVLGLPVAGGPGPDEERFSARYFDEHPASAAGVAVDGSFRPVGHDGAPVYGNLRAAGATLHGAQPWREKSGNGISLTSGLGAAEAILTEG